MKEFITDLLVKVKNAISWKKLAELQNSESTQVITLPNSWNEIYILANYYSINDDLTVSIIIPLINIFKDQTTQREIYTREKYSSYFNNSSAILNVGCSINRLRIRFLSGTEDDPNNLFSGFVYYK